MNQSNFLEGFGLSMDTMLASANTGDNNIFIFIALGIVAAALLVFYFIRKRKN